MSDPFLAEIRIFAGSFAPTGWALCDGQLLPISQNTALFSLLGTTYGGNGTSTFALPNLQGNAPMQAGQGQGLSIRDLGEVGGEQTVTLLQTEMPSHAHTAPATSSAGTDVAPGNGEVWAVPGAGRGIVAYDPSGGGGQMSDVAVSIAGGSQPHNNMPPYLTLTFIIALQGIFPARS